MKLFKFVVLALGISIAGAAAAHSDEYLETQQAPNGGQLRMAGGYHYELVLKPTGKGDMHDVLVYLTDHAGTQIDTKGATGNATILSKSKLNVPLQADGKNVMRGAANFGFNPKLKAVVSITLPGQSAEQARFTPFAKAGAAEGHKH